MKTIYGAILGLALMAFSNVNASANYKFYCEVCGMPSYFDEIDFPFIQNILNDKEPVIVNNLCPYHLFNALNYYWSGDAKATSLEEDDRSLTIARLGKAPFDIENDQGCIEDDLTTAVAFTGEEGFLEGNHSYCELCGDPCFWQDYYLDEPFYKSFGMPFNNEWYPYPNCLCPRHFFEFNRTGFWGECGFAPNQDQEKIDTTYLEEECVPEEFVEPDDCIATLFPIIINHSSMDSKSNLTANASRINSSADELSSNAGKVDIILPTYPAQRPSSNSSVLYCSLDNEIDPCLIFDPFSESECIVDDLDFTYSNGGIDDNIPFPYRYFPKGGERGLFEDSAIAFTASEVASLVISEDKDHLSDISDPESIYDANVISRNFDCPCCRRFYNDFDDPCWGNPCGHIGPCPPGR